MANNIDLIGDAETLLQILKDDFSETNGVFEDNLVEELRDRALYQCFSLKSARFPNATSVKARSFENCRFLSKIYLPSLITVANYGLAYIRGAALIDAGYISAIGTAAFASCTSLVAVAIRSSTVTPLNNVNAFSDTRYATDGAGGAYVYVPRSLIASYQAANNWSTLYAAHSDMFRALEDYTVDGTTTGELDEDKMLGAHTPTYTLENTSFDGETAIDTGVQLFDGTNNNCFSVAIDFTLDSWSNDARILWCCDGDGGSNGYGFWLGRRINNNTNLSAHCMPPNASSKLFDNPSWSLANGSRARMYLIFNGTTITGRYYPETTDSAFNGSASMSGSVSSIANTLRIGGSDLANGNYWKGTIHKLAVYKGVAIEPWEAITWF